MKKYLVFDDALKVAKKLSNKLTKPIEIITRCCEKEYIVCTSGNDRKPHDRFVKLVVNFDSPIEVYSHSNQNGDHWDKFPNDKLADEYIKTIQHRTMIRKTDLRCVKKI